MKGIVMALACLSIAAAAHAAAPSADSTSALRGTASGFVSGDRIRITNRLPWETRVSGWFESLESDSVLLLRLARSEPPVRLDLRQIEIVEAGMGSKRHGLAGAAAGLLLGTIVGLAVTANEPDPSVNLPYAGPVRMRGLRQSAGAITGAAVGLVAGGVIGYLIRTERWSVVTRSE